MMQLRGERKLIVSIENMQLFRAIVAPFASLSLSSSHCRRIHAGLYAASLSCTGIKLSKIETVRENRCYRDTRIVVCAPCIQRCRSISFDRALRMRPYIRIERRDNVDSSRDSRANSRYLPNAWRTWNSI